MSAISVPRCIYIDVSTHAMDRERYQRERHGKSVRFVTMPTIVLQSSDDEEQKEEAKRANVSCRMPRC